jgi:hypothetical protein
MPRPVSHTLRLTSRSNPGPAVAGRHSIGRAGYGLPREARIGMPSPGERPCAPFGARSFRALIQQFAATPARLTLLPRASRRSCHRSLPQSRESERARHPSPRRCFAVGLHVCRFTDGLQRRGGPAVDWLVKPIDDCGAARAVRRRHTDRQDRARDDDGPAADPRVRHAPWSAVMADGERVPHRAGRRLHVRRPSRGRHGRSGGSG